jgi:hypothetical protein
MVEMLDVVGEQAYGLNLTTCIYSSPDMNVEVYTDIHIYMHYMYMTRPEPASSVVHN